MSNRYWVSNIEGNWSDANNWGTSTGGAGGASPPIYMDDVIFDANGDGNCIIDYNLIDVTGAVRSLTASGYVGNIYNRANKINIQNNLTWYSAGTLNLGSGVSFIGGDLRVGSGAFQMNRSTITVNGSLDLSGISSFSYHNSGAVVLGGNQVAGTDYINFSDKGFPTLIIDSQYRTKKWTNAYAISGYSLYGYNGILDPSSKAIQISGKLSFVVPFSLLKSNTSSISVSGRFLVQGIYNHRADLEFPSPVTLSIQSGMGAIAHANVSNLTSNNPIGVFNNCDAEVDPECGDVGSNTNLAFHISPCSLCYFCGSGGTEESPTVPQTPNVINITVAGVTNSESGMFDLCRDRNSPYTTIGIRDYDVVGIAGGVRQWEISSPNCNIAEGTPVFPIEEAVLYPPYYSPIYDIALIEDAPCNLLNAHEKGAMVCVGCSEYNGVHDLNWTPIDFGSNGIGIPSRITCHWKKCFAAPCRVENMRVRDFADDASLTAYDPFKGLLIHNYNWVESDSNGVWELLECTGYLPHLCDNTCGVDCYSDLGNYWYYDEPHPNVTLQALLTGNNGQMQYPSFEPDTFIALYSIQPTFATPGIEGCTPDMTEEECNNYRNGMHQDFGDLYLVIGKYCDECDNIAMANHTGGNQKITNFDYNCDLDSVLSNNNRLANECGYVLSTDMQQILSTDKYEWYSYSPKDYSCINSCPIDNNNPQPGLDCYNENECLRRLFYNKNASMIWKMNREEFFPATGFPHCMDDMFPITFTYQHLLTKGMRIGECDFSNASITLNSASGPLETGNCAPPGCACCNQTSSSTSSSSSSSVSSSSTSSSSSSSSSVSSSSSSVSSSSTSSSSSSVASSSSSSESSSSSGQSSSSSAQSSSSSGCSGCAICEQVGVFNLSINFPEDCKDRCELPLEECIGPCDPVGGPFGPCEVELPYNAGVVVAPICTDETAQDEATCVYGATAGCDNDAGCLSGGYRLISLLCQGVDPGDTTCENYWFLNGVITCNGGNDCLGASPGVSPSSLIETETYIIMTWTFPQECEDCCDCEGNIQFIATGNKA